MCILQDKRHMTAWLCIVTPHVTEWRLANSTGTLTWDGNVQDKRIHATQTHTVLRHIDSFMTFCDDWEADVTDRTAELHRNIQFTAQKDKVLFLFSFT